MGVVSFHADVGERATAVDVVMYASAADIDPGVAVDLSRGVADGSREVGVVDATSTAVDVAEINGLWVEE